MKAQNKLYEDLSHDVDEINKSQLLKSIESTYDKIEARNYSASERREKICSWVEGLVILQRGELLKE